MEYSFNLKKTEGFIFAQSYDLNVSYKHLGAACDAIRYVRADQAIEVLDRVISMERAIPFRRHNKHMGSRHELGGNKGAYPVKAATELRKTLVNAIANAVNEAMNGDEMFVVHASANKTHIENRYPSRGSIAWGRGMYGRSAMNHSNLEFAKIEIVLAEKDSKELTKNMKYFIAKKEKEIKIMLPKKKDAPKAPAKKTTEKKDKQKPGTDVHSHKPEPIKVTPIKQEEQKKENKPSPAVENQLSKGEMKSEEEQNTQQLKGQ